MKGKYIAAFVLVLISVSALTWATKCHFFNTSKTAKKAVAVIDTVQAENNYDPALLEKFQKVSAGLDAGQPECLIIGIINSVNHADSSDVLKDLNYIYSKKGADFYYKLGETETINAHNICIYIDHTSRQVIISPYRTEPEAGFTDIKQLLAGLRSENYNLKSKIQGNQETISLINEDQINLKEYRVSFDTLNLKASTVYARYANPEQPERTDNEKVMEIRLSVLADQSGIEKYIAKPVVDKVGDRFTLDKRLEGYELIQM